MCTESTPTDRDDRVCPHVPSFPRRVVEGGYEQPKSDAQVLLQRLLLELEGLFEPHAWAKLWKEGPQTKLEASLAARMEFMMRGVKAGEKGKEKEEEEEEEEEEEAWSDVEEGS